MSKYWSLDSRRVSLGLPNYTWEFSINWNSHQGGHWRPFSMPALIWRSDGTESYSPRRYGVLMRWDGPAGIAGGTDFLWWWHGLRVSLEHHRWKRRSVFVRVLRDVHFGSAILAAL